MHCNSQIQSKESYSRQKSVEIIYWLRDYAQRRINSRLMDERRCITPHIVLDFGKKGLLGMLVPQSSGGVGLTYRDMFQVVQQLAAIDLNLASFVGVNNVLGIYPILKYGTPQIKETYLPNLAQGRDLAAFAITEPSAGSNPRGIKAEAHADGNGGWLLSGTKIWSGSASWSTMINTFAHVIDEQGESLGVTAFTIPEDAPGLRQGAEAPTMGMRGMVQNTIHLEQVKANRENILGEIGLGFAVAQDAMQLGRLGIAVMCIGGMKRCAQLMLRYATGRSIGIERLIDQQITLQRLSHLTAAIGAVECLVNFIATSLDEEKFVPPEAYLVTKIIAPELMWQAADNLVQLLGGRGYIESNIAPQIFRDARLFRIFEGPTETLQMHLGLLALYHTSQLCSSFNAFLGITEISDKLQYTAEYCASYLKKQNLSRSSQKKLSKILSQKLADVAAWGFVLACIQKCYQSQPSSELKRVEQWGQQNFLAKIADAMNDNLANDILLGTNQLENLINQYTENIGNVEQNMVGEENQLDEYLCKIPNVI
ncbi:MAG: acyl-CoA dehydrogenase family protein [Sphaerospermopsis kisseleviana]|jgi:alkylation response protein AidB-like acyl-CoA dehydrogenase|uniref:Acyl-CoA/acyl-ACP dehydrogenase n=1 Tax=Sphaerospermopsis aphanizomenoides LEGE 00250 TaxID=2777972 RepID=A0ABR9V9Z8_9CYAN|nr:acyl-CoA dehydrogenase family protein [Sphaerospermopsis aphanizomenoides]MBE9235321.1 acyl-CoA/acyl-ACP dehydrogenase [Sphaerospermopsis aphanizomenoides LEGE 00250]